MDNLVCLIYALLLAEESSLIDECNNRIENLRKDTSDYKLAIELAKSSLKLEYYNELSSKIFKALDTYNYEC